MVPPPSSATTTSSCGTASSEGTSIPGAPYRNVTSPMNASVRRRSASAIPAAVEMVPSMPASPRFAYTRGPRPLRGVAAMSMSRTGRDDPITEGPYKPAHTSAARDGPVSRPVTCSRSATTMFTAATTRSSASRHASTHPSGPTPANSAASAKLRTGASRRLDNSHHASGPGA